MFKDEGRVVELIDEIKQVSAKVNQDCTITKVWRMEKFSKTRMVRTLN